MKDYLAIIQYKKAIENTDLIKNIDEEPYSLNLTLHTVPVGIMFLVTLVFVFNISKGSLLPFYVILTTGIVYLTCTYFGIRYANKHYYKAGIIYKKHKNNIFTGKLESIFNFECSITKNALKKSQGNIIYDYSKFKGLKFGTIFNILNEIEKERQAIAENNNFHEKMRAMETENPNIKHNINKVLHL